MDPSEPSVTLLERFEPHEAELLDVLHALDEPSFLDAVVRLFGRSLQGVPVVGPFARESLARLWAASAYAGMEAALQALRAEQDAATQRAKLAAELEVGVMAALRRLQGQSTAGWTHFDEAFAAAMAQADVAVKRMVVEAGGIGVQVSPDSQKRLALEEGEVRGKGSVGLQL